jgi:hypothetical protein
MIVTVETLEAEIASVFARDQQSSAHSREGLTLASLFHDALAGNGPATPAEVVLPANMVVMAIIKARQKLTPLRDAVSGEGARLDRICRATAFTLGNQPGEIWVRLTSLDAQMIKAWSPSD